MDITSDARIYIFAGLEHGSSRVGTVVLIETIEYRKGRHFFPILENFLEDSDNKVLH